MFKLTSLNVNGIRSGATQGVEAWAHTLAPDCIGVPEMTGRLEAVIEGRYRQLRFNTPGGCLLASAAAFAAAHGGQNGRRSSPAC